MLHMKQMFFKKCPTWNKCSWFLKGVYNMGLDFSRIYQISNMQQPEKERISQPEQMQNFIRLDAISDTNKKNLEMYQAYQHNILAAGTLTSEITKGLQQGKPIASLFLQAINRKKSNFTRKIVEYWCCNSSVDKNFSACYNILMSY